VEAAASRDMVRAALAPTANPHTCSGSSAPSPPAVGGFGEKTPLRRRTLGEGLNLVFIGVALGFGREGGRLVVRLSDVASIHDCQRKRAAAMGGRRARASLYACVSGEEKGE
jgi:hypothetical protein